MEELKMAKYTIAKAKKLTTLGKVEWGMSMQSCNNPEQFTVHVQQVITVIKQGEDCWDQEGMHKKAKRVTDEPYMITLWYSPQELWLNHKAL